MPTTDQQEATMGSTDQHGTSSTTDALVRLAREQRPALLPQPTLGLAGYGVPNPADPDGLWLSDGYATPEDATTAAHAAWVYMASGASPAWALRQAAAMMDEHLGEWSDMGKDMWGSRPRTEAGLRQVRATYWADRYSSGGQVPLY